MNTLIVISGLALLLGGILWLVTSIIHPNNHEPTATASRFWHTALGGQALSYLLLVPGVVGLYVAQADSLGVTGLIGFLLALLGSCLTFATNLNMTFLLPPHNAAQPTAQSVMALIGPQGPYRWLSLLTATYLVTFVPGFILLGAALLPSIVGWLLIIGMIVSNIGAPIKPLFILRHIGGVIFGIGLAWLGLGLLAG